MGGRGSEFKCHGECQIDWRQVWEQVLAAGRPTIVPSMQGCKYLVGLSAQEGSAESVGQSHLVFNPRVQSIQFWLVLVLAVAV
jgi:hypothetical protein